MPKRKNAFHFHLKRPPLTQLQVLGGNHPETCFARQDWQLNDFFTKFQHSEWKEWTYKSATPCNMFHYPTVEESEGKELISNSKYKLTQIVIVFLTILGTVPLANVYIYIYIFTCRLKNCLGSKDPRFEGSPSALRYGGSALKAGYAGSLIVESTLQECWDVQWTCDTVDGSEILNNHLGCIKPDCCTYFFRPIDPI